MPELELDYYFRDLDNETMGAKLARWTKSYWFVIPCFMLPCAVAFLFAGGTRAKNVLDSV